MTPPTALADPVGRRRSARRWLVLGLLAALLVLLAVAGTRAAVAARDLQRAQSLLTGLTADDAELDVARTQRALDEAQPLVDRAAQHLSTPSVRLLAAVPVLGRSLAAERAVAEASQSALAAATLVVQAAPDLAVDGAVDVAALSSLGERLSPLAQRAAADLAVLRSIPTGATPGVVQDAVADAESALGPVVDGLVRGATSAPLVADLLGASGPRRVLVALENNAELKGTGGFVTSVAPGVVVDGRLELDPFVLVEDVGDKPEQARRVPAPPEYVEDFGVFLADTTLWKTWTMSPDVPDAASVTAEVARELLGAEPDVVVLVDVPALAALVTLGGGELQLPSGELIGGEDLVEALLVDAYAESGASFEDQLDRRAALTEAAGQTVPRLLAGGAQPLDVVRELARLARGRHFAVWSAQPEEQAVLESLGLAGSADPGGDDLSLVSANNLTANKLDYYVDRTVTVEVTVGGREAEVVQRVQLVNRAPADLVPYVAGIVTPGIATERIELSISPRARFTSLRRNGGPAEGDVRTGVERTRVHTYVQLVRDEPVVVELRYTVPVDDGRYRLHLLPQPLARDAALEVVVQAADGWRLDEVDGAERDSSRGASRRGPFAERELLEVTVTPDD
jgi:hypothetical protein